MIISKTPFRVSFVGGGSDIESFYRKNGYGAVVSTTINKYMYIMLHPYFHQKIRIKYSKLEDVESVEEIKHPIVRECLKLLKVEKGIEIASIADVPAGTGIGSSSSFTVGLLHTLYAYKHKNTTKEELAKKAAMIEIDILKEPIGKQDQYAVSFGGLNYIRFNRNGTVEGEPLILSPQKRKTLENNLLLFYTGGQRRTKTILKKQKENIKEPEKFNNLKTLVKFADELRDALIRGKIDVLGELLHESWKLKRTLAANITNPMIDEYYDKAIEAGAIGGKLLGAGGCGFLVFYCKPKCQNAVRKALNLRELSINFDRKGTELISW